MKLNALQERLLKNAVIISARQSIYSRVSQEYNAYLKMEDISEVVTKGTTPQTYGFGFAPEGTPFLRAEDVLDGEICYERTTLFIDADTNDFMNRSRTCAGDILITIAGTIGRAAVVPKTAPELNMNQAVALIRCKKQVNPLYVYHMLQAHDIQQKITESTVTSAISNLSLNKIKDLRIPIPPIEDQNIIALFLEEVRKKQNSLTDHNQLPNYLKDIPLLISKIVLLASKIEEARGIKTDQQEKTDFLFEAILKHTRLNLLQGPTPKKKLGEITSVTSGGTPARTMPNYWEGDIPWIKTGELLDNDIHQSEEYITEEGLEGSSAKLFPRNTILIALYGQGQTRGRTGRLMIEATTNQACCAILPNPLILNERFTQYWLRSLYTQMRQDAHGGAQPNWNSQTIKNIEIPLLSLEDQKYLVSYFDSVQTQTNLLKHQQTQTSAELNALLPSILDKAFKGEL